jgi:four helix bundle protein
MAYMFERPYVYRRAVDSADELAAMTGSFPCGHGLLVDQLNRAALTIAANLTEGNGRVTKPDRKNVVGTARGSTQSSSALLELAVRRGLARPDRHEIRVL